MKSQTERDAMDSAGAFDDNDDFDEIEPLQEFSDFKGNPFDDAKPLSISEQDKGPIDNLVAEFVQ